MKCTIGRSRKRVSRDTLAAVDKGLSQRPNDSELLLRRAVAQTFLGIALLRQNNTPPEAVSVLEQAVTGYHDAPPAMAFTENREIYSSMAIMNLAEALATTGNHDRAKSLAESGLTAGPAALTHQPENWEGKEIRAENLVLLASMLDLAKTAEASRRQSLLDEASTILTSPESEGRLKADDKETLAKIASLRGSAEAKKKPEIQQP